MSLAEMLAAGAPKPRKGPACSMNRIISLLSQSERDSLNVMLDNDSGAWTGRVIADALLLQYGVQINPEVINRHRRGGCSCEPR